LKNIFSLNDNVILADNYLSHIPLLKEWLEKDNNEIQEITKNIIEKITNNLGVDTIKDNRILKSIEYLTYNINKSIKISEVADFVCLSESRFAHLFKLQVGIPFRRYILWLRIQKTLLSFLDGNSFTSASYDGGFTDISHFNRTFKEMFGNTPSAILKS
jgi:AraC-like DNA-binding protein